MPGSFVHANYGAGGNVHQDPTRASANVFLPQSIQLFGDSYLAQNYDITYTGANPVYTNRASEGFFNWANMLLGNRFKNVKFSGIGGQTVENLLTRYPIDVQGQPYRVVLLNTGANNFYGTVGISTVEDLAAKTGALIDMVLAEGKIPVIITELPHTFTGAQSLLNAHMTFNRWIMAGCGGRRVYVIDAFSAVVDESNVNCAPLATRVWDAVHHPNNMGAYRIGKACVPVLNLLEPALRVVGGYADFTNSGNLNLGLRANLLDNPAFQGTAGTNTTGGAGTPPTGYALTGTGGGAADVTMTDYLDPDTGAAVGKYVELACTFGANNDSVVLSSADISARMGGKGTAYKSRCGFRVVTPGVIKTARFRIKGDSGSAETAWCNNDDKGNVQNYLEDTGDMIGVTGYCAVVGNAVVGGNGLWQFFVVGSAAGTGTVRIWLPSVEQVVGYPQ